LVNIFFTPQTELRENLLRMFNSTVCIWEPEKWGTRNNSLQVCHYVIITRAATRVAASCNCELRLTLNAANLVVMVLKLYGAALSTCTRRVALIAKEKGVPYELISIDLIKAEHKSPAFRENQPFGQVPYIVRAHLSFFPIDCLSSSHRCCLG